MVINFIILPYLIFLNLNNHSINIQNIFLFLFIILNYNLLFLNIFLNHLNLILFINLSFIMNKLFIQSMIQKNQMYNMIQLQQILLILFHLNFMV